MLASYVVIFMLEGGIVGQEQGLGLGLGLSFIYNTFEQIFCVHKIVTHNAS